MPDAVRASFSFLADLRCLGCGATHEVGYRLSCPCCGGLLELRFDTNALAARRPDELSGRGMWRYHWMLPARAPEHVVSMGEGGTPMLDARRLARHLGIRRLWLKFEGTNPTGTVKDRTSSTALTAAREFGFPAVGVVSTGNAGSSIASYAAWAGLRSFIFCYERGSQPKMAHMAACASDFILYRGGYDDMIGIFDRLVEELPVFDCGASRNPFKHEGKKTLAYEVAEDLGWRAPDYYVSPVGVGETFIASHRGFEELRAAGWIERTPRMIAAQSDRADPVVAALRSGGGLVGRRIGYTVAEGVAVGDPKAKGAWVLRILRENGGLAAAVSDEEVLAAQALVARAEGVWAGPTGCVSLAALIRLVREGAIDPGGEAVCVLTETGLKGEYARVEREPVAPEYASIRALVEARLAAGQ